MIYPKTMSTLYSNSLIRKASGLNDNALTSSDGNKYWKYDWFTPAKSQQNNDSTTATGESGEDKYAFKYKNWVPVEKSVLTQDQADDKDYLELKKFDRTRLADQEQIVSTTNGHPSENTLTMDDIRGAVGGGESIPGFSGSDAITNKEKEETESFNGIAKEDETPNTDADGDIKVD